MDPIERNKDLCNNPKKTKYSPIKLLVPGKLKLAILKIKKYTQKTGINKFNPE
jgi:hypothetical protein